MCLFQSVIVFTVYVGTGCLSTGYHTPTVGVPIRLTKDTLLQTQKHRAMDVGPKPEVYAGYVFPLLLFFVLQPACRVAFVLFFYGYFFLLLLTSDVVFSSTVVWARTPRTIPIILCHGRTARCIQLAVIRMRRPTLILCR